MRLVEKLKPAAPHWGCYSYLLASTASKSEAERLLLYEKRLEVVAAACPNFYTWLVLTGDATFWIFELFSPLIKDGYWHINLITDDSSLAHAINKVWCSETLS